MLSKDLEVVHNLLGTSITPDWKVVEKCARLNTDTGGCFSVTYIVERKDGHRAFLKVLNLSRVLAMPGDQLKALQYYITAFNFERDMMDLCATHNLGRVARAITHGKLDIAGNNVGVYYIIFELAEGDIRRHLAKIGRADTAWFLRALHHTANGILQLHSRGVAHQDLKPSNVLLFGKHGAKVADLGCADVQGGTSPRGHMAVAGDPSYQPPELAYGDVSPQWERRRLGTDMYLFGSLITFVFAQITMTAAILDRMHPHHRPGMWPSDFKSVLPYVRQAFGEAMVEIRAVLPDRLRDEMGEVIEYLCDPDPAKRGETAYTGKQQYNFERVVSMMNRLAAKEELAISKN
jgi:serine/threonine protein kinase